MINIEDIRKFFRGCIVLNESLSKYTSFRIGGPADYYLEPEDKDDTVAIVNYFQDHRLPFLMMGKGSNMLVSDDGIRGAVINLEEGLRDIHVDGGRVIVEAGVSMARFVDFCIQCSYKGVEMLPGIPGTIGGAIIMNAGAYGGEISDYIVDVDVLRGGTVITVSKEQARFSYRHSGFEGDIILSASFKLPEGDKAEIMKQRRELLIKRNRAQPVNFPNSGSMFKNPQGNYAAKLIEEGGLKGARIGNAQISEKHANFIVNLGNARAHDVLSLLELARDTVLKKFGIKLELEVKLIGFSEDVYQELYA